MKPRLSPKRNAAMTLFEVGIVVAVVMILTVVFLPGLHSRNRGPSGRITCVNNLKQLGLAYRIWEGDNNDLAPMGVSVTNGGSMEMVATGDVLQTFLVISNELSTPKVLYCPADSSRTWTASFGGLANSHISYFVGVDATNDANSQGIISGDCNLEVGGVPVKTGLQAVGGNDPVGWAATRHVKAGNIGLADGSVMQMTVSGLTNALGLTGLATNRFAIP